MIPPHLEKNARLERARERWRRLWTTPSIVLGALLCCAVSWSSVQYLSHYLSLRHRASGPASTIVHGIAYAFLAFAFVIIVGSVVSAFRRGSRGTLLRRAVTSYFSLMIVFASVYYVAAFLGDFEDAIFKYDHYRADALAGAPERVYRGRRSFDGIERRFWTGVDWEDGDQVVVDGIPATFTGPTVTQMRTAATTRTLEQAVRFIPSARTAIFADCLHFSVATMTTVGYGDIAPRSIAARVTADCEAVSNTMLLIFGLGMIFGNWRPPAPERGEARPSR